MLKTNTSLIFPFLLVFLFISEGVGAQAVVEQDSINRKRLNTVIIATSVAYTATLATLYFAWYKDSPKSAFHFSDDKNYWLQVDKIGHATTAYTFTNYGYWMLKWAGVPEKKSIWYGGLIGWTSMTVIEILDGFSAEYGASPTDLLANTLGTGFFIGQQFLWKEQRIRIKFSYHPTEYAQYRSDQLGETSLQRVLKDYNGQTYWLSANINSFIKRENKFPRWINVSAGYGAKGMLGPESNPAYDEEGNPLPHYDRVRQYYLSADIDWTRIRTNSGFLRFVFKTLSFIKLPFPTLEYNKQDGFVWYWLYM